jgi:16S rRNA (guanine527-N7)-methyltransferase
VTEDEARDEVGRRVSRETFARLESYVACLRKWQPKVNLVARGTLPELWSRHVLDSLQVLTARDRDAGRWLDLGSGGGFPGLVCAIAASEVAPDLDFVLVDSDIRKCAFLREAARETGTKVDVLSARAEDLPPQEASVISARALAPLPQLLAWAHPHLAADGICLLQKGAGHRAELESAAAGWHMDVENVPSVTAPDSVILRIRNLAHAA